MELFAGQGNLSAAFRAFGKHVASFDREYGGDAMDITKSAGFLLRPRLHFNRTVHSEGGHLAYYVCRHGPVVCIQMPVQAQGL